MAAKQQNPDKNSIRNTKYSNRTIYMQDIHGVSFPKMTA